MSGLLWWLNGKESTWQCRRHRFSPWVRKIPWRRKWQPAPELLPGESHGQRSLAGYSPWDRKWVRHGLATEQQGEYDDLTYILIHGEITITAKLIHQPKKLLLACTNYQGNANQNHLNLYFSGLLLLLFSRQSCPTLCNPMDCSTPGLPVHHHLLEFAQTHVHWVGDAIQPSHLLSPTYPPALNLSQQQGLFQWVASSHQTVKPAELQRQSFQWIFRFDFL